jgi:hypothetical protein
MPSSVQYPLERRRDVQGRWGRLLQRTARSTRSDLLLGLPALVNTTPPRDRNGDDDIDDDEEEHEDEEDREPAVIREPDNEE